LTLPSIIFNTIFFAKPETGLTQTILALGLWPAGWCRIIPGLTSSVEPPDGSPKVVFNVVIILGIAWFDRVGGCNGAGLQGEQADGDRRHVGGTSAGQRGLH
jgi:hypothetical protein